MLRKHTRPLQKAGSEFGIDGKKTYGTDAPLRPCLQLSEFAEYLEKDSRTKLIAALGKIRKYSKALNYGDYQEVLLTNRQYAFSRNMDGETALIAVNNDDGEAGFRLPAGKYTAYVGMLSGKKVQAVDGWIQVTVPGCDGEIFLPEEHANETAVRKMTEEHANETAVEKVTEEPEKPKTGYVDLFVTEGKAYEAMTIEELQEAILSKMAKNGPITDQMLRSVRENIYPGSLLNWVKSFQS